MTQGVKQTVDNARRTCRKAHMNKKYGLLIFLLVALTAWIAWKATEPNPYTYGPDESFVHPYPWQYAVWMFVYGTVVIGLLSFKKPLWSFIGATVAFGLAAFSFTILILGAMHSPPVHDSLFYVMFFTSIGLLFFSGYTCAIWRIGTRESDEVA